MTAPKKQTRGTAPMLGPRVASWNLSRPGSHGGSSTSHRELAHREAIGALEYNPVPFVVERVEHCPEPGCDDDGQVAYRKRGAMFFAHRPCPTCAHSGAFPPVVEPHDPEAARRALAIWG